MDQEPLNSQESLIPQAISEEPEKVDEHHTRSVSQDHKEKMKAGRAIYWENYRKEKELRKNDPKIKNGKLTQKDYKFIREGISTNPREMVVEEISKHKMDILKAQIQAAVGMHFVTADGNKTFTKAPNVATGEYLLNQLIGKPTESLEVKQITKIQVDI